MVSPWLGSLEPGRMVPRVVHSSASALTTLPGASAGCGSQGFEWLMDGLPVSLTRGTILRQQREGDN